MKRTLFIIVLLTLSLTATETSQAQSLSLGYQQTLSASEFDFDAGLGTRLSWIEEAGGVALSLDWNREATRTYSYDTVCTTLEFIPFSYETRGMTFSPYAGLGIGFFLNEEDDISTLGGEQGALLAVVGTGLEIGPVNLNAGYQVPIESQFVDTGLRLGIGIDVL